MTGGTEELAEHVRAFLGEIYDTLSKVGPGGTGQSVPSNFGFQRSRLDTYREAIDNARQRYRRRQLMASVRDDPELLPRS